MPLFSAQLHQLLVSGAMIFDHALPELLDRVAGRFPLCEPTELDLCASARGRLRDEVTVGPLELRAGRCLLGP
jgi:hypothetical protein